MSSRIIIVVYALDDSPKIDYAIRTLNNVLETTDFKKHELFISDNGSGSVMQEFYKDFKKRFKTQNNPNNLTISYNGENLGTARAVNLGIIGRTPGQFIIKRDDDTIVYDNTWVEQMEEVIQKDSTIGIVGLKRWDLEQHPDNLSYPSNLRMLPHIKGEKWIVVEETHDIIGTSTMLNPILLDRIGGYAQPLVYGWDDSLISLRSRLAGFKNTFLPHIRIDHIDEGGDSFTKWKQDHATEGASIFNEMAEDYKRGVRDLYEPLTEEE